MDTELASIFNGPVSEGNCPGPAPVACFPGPLPEDLTDSPISSMTVINDSSVYITKPIGGLGTAGQFAYNSNWQSVINDENMGIPNFFTWLDAYSPNPKVPGTVRQAFAGTTATLNPYVASSARDFYIIGNIYDSLSAESPLSHTQILDWMTVSSQQLTNSQLTYVPPPGTVASFRFALRNDIFFQDGRKVTAFDVAFSYLSLRATGSPQGTYDASSMTGATVLSPTQFDISVNGTTALTFSRLTSLSILPGKYWTAVGSSSWDLAVTSCTQQGSNCYPAQYSLGALPPSGPPLVQCSLICNFSPSNLNPDTTKTTPSFDPISNHVLVGSSAFECGTRLIAGYGCSSSGSQNPSIGGSYTLQRFGKDLPPASSISGDYFRSNGNLALWLWSQNNGDLTHDFLNFSVIAQCFGKPAEPLGSTTACGHFQQGIGAGGGPSPVGLSQVSIVDRFVGVNWVSPFDWHLSPPIGIQPFSQLVLHEGSATLNPASIVGCNTAYPTGGYDC